MNLHTGPFTVEFLGTPEAGKTTTIHRIKEELSDSMNISILRESAEIVPDYFGKGTLEAHFWMRLTTSKSMLETKYSGNSDEIFIVDCGIIDTIFWDYYYGLNGTMSAEKVTHANVFFQDLGMLPNIVIYLSTTPEEAIKRRGGEGRIVTKEFVSNFNNALSSFLKTVSIPVYSLDTTLMSKDDVFLDVKNAIVSAYNARS